MRASHSPIALLHCHLMALRTLICLIVSREPSWIGRDGVGEMHGYGAKPAPPITDLTRGRCEGVHDSLGLAVKGILPMRLAVLNFFRVIANELVILPPIQWMNELQCGP